MPIIERYPHKVEFAIETKGTTDANGDYHEGTTYWSDAISCRAVPESGKQTEIVFDDGEKTKVKYVCHLPKQSHLFMFGDKVKVYFADGIESVLRVTGFVPYTLEDRLWVG